jgi:hypothetical protein
MRVASPGNWKGSPTPSMPVNNAPTGQNQTVQTYVRGLPVPRLPVRPLAGSQLPGTATGVPGTPVGYASGNPDVWTEPSIAPPKRPYGQPRALGVGQESAWRGGLDFSNDKLTTADRHLVTKTGTEYSGRDSGLTDPPKDGPARPSFYAVNRTINYQEGSDNTANQDDLTRPYTRNPQGMYVGEQGTGWIGVNGGVPGLWQPYGSYAGYTNGPVQGIQSPVAQGSQGDGRQSVWSGPPHGLHSPTLPDYSNTLGYYMSVPQMRLPRVDRPSNSTSSGQSYSQTVIPQGQTGTAAQQSSGIGAGVNWQTTRRQGWRGQAGAGNAS